MVEELLEKYFANKQTMLRWLLEFYAKCSSSNGYQFIVYERRYSVGVKSLVIKLVNANYTYNYEIIKGENIELYIFRNNDMKLMSEKKIIDEFNYKGFFNLLFIDNLFDDRCDIFIDNIECGLLKEFINRYSRVKYRDLEDMFMGFLILVRINGGQVNISNTEAYSYGSRITLRIKYNKMVLYIEENCNVEYNDIEGKVREEELFSLFFSGDKDKISSCFI